MTLYHYCSTATFFNIIKNRSIWLSSLQASNDTQEGRVISTVIARMCKEVGADPAVAEYVAHQFRIFEQGDCLGFCMSSEGDMLSQWRGYADDATGVAVGFSSEFTEKISEQKKLHMPIKLSRVIYDSAEQAELLRDQFNPIALAIKNGDFQNIGTQSDALADIFKESDSLLIATAMSCIDISYVTKNPAFQEEREWRLFKESEDDYKECSYRVRGDALIPYMEVAFPTSVRRPIDHVIIGPKNRTPKKVFRTFLNSHNIHCVLDNSSATYR